MIPFADILVVIKWLVALNICSYVGVFFLAKKGSQAFILRYAVGKGLGILTIALTTWLLSLIRILPFTFEGILLAVAFFYILFWTFRRQEIIAVLKENWRRFLIIELFFAGLFFIGVFLRATHPRIEGIEKFMDSAILSNLLRHRIGVPVDTWYAPDSLNYYYFGHWLVATIAKLSATNIGHAFNLGMATILALASTSVFGLVWQLAKSKLGALFGVFLAFFASNLHPFIQVLGGEKDYFFFASGRFIEEVINEYPLYSFILGDLHAHMMALALSMTYYGLIVLLALEKREFRWLSIMAGALSGLMVATNTFDVFPAGLAFGLIVFYLYKTDKIKGEVIFKMVGLYIVAAVSIGLVFLSHFHPAVGGLAIDLFKTPFSHIIWQFGLPLALAVSAFYLIFKTKKRPAREVYLALLLGIVAVVFIILPEIIFFKDIYFYQNPPFARANTVFKLWYSAWPLLAVSASTLVVYAARSIKSRHLRKLYIGAVVISCIALCYGLFFGLKTLVDPHPNTINGLYYLQAEQPQKLEVLKWVEDNIQGQPLVLQAPGDSYTTQSWFSSYSGLPSVLGWASHEWGWRYSSQQWSVISQRIDSLEKLYQSDNAEEMRQLAFKFNAGYLLIGPEEAAKYQINTEIINQAFGKPVFGNSQYALYRVN